jgi:hypothetical protein
MKISEHRRREIHRRIRIIKTEDEDQEDGGLLKMRDKDIVKIGLRILGQPSDDLRTDEKEELANKNREEYDEEKPDPFLPADQLRMPHKTGEIAIPF